MSVAWLIAGMLLGMGLAWVAEYWLDWRDRPRDAALEAEAAHAVQAALAGYAAENARLQEELVQLRAHLAELQRAMTSGSATEAPPL